MVRQHGSEGKAKGVVHGEEEHPADGHKSLLGFAVEVDLVVRSFLPRGSPRIRRPLEVVEARKTHPTDVRGESYDGGCEGVEGAEGDSRD